MHYLRESGSVSLCHAAISLGAGLGQGAGLVLPTHRYSCIHHDNSIIAQWLSTASPSSPQRWTDLEDCNTLYTHAVLFSLMPLNLLNAVEGREQGNYGNDPALFVYSALVVFVHPGQVLTTIHNAKGFSPASVWRHPAGWSLHWLVQSLQTALLRDVTVLPHGPTHAVFGIAHVSTIQRPNCLTPALPKLCRLWCWLHDYTAAALHAVPWHGSCHAASGITV